MEIIVLSQLPNNKFIYWMWGLKIEQNIHPRIESREFYNTKFIGCPIDLEM